MCADTMSSFHFSDDKPKLLKTSFKITMYKRSALQFHMSLLGVDVCCQKRRGKEDKQNLLRIVMFKRIVLDSDMSGLGRSIDDV